MNKYFYAKIGAGNRYAADYLMGNNEINAPAIPIYFNGEPSNKDDFLKNGGAKEQGRNFFNCGESNEGKNIIVIHNGEVVISEPCGDVVFKKSNDEIKHIGYIKLLPIKIVKRISITNVPAILASIAQNRYYYSGTFREIKVAGNIKAIESVLYNCSIACTSKNNPSVLLECLSSFELETLIAKILEEKGCFVPAYRGGNMKGADIFAYNDSSNPLSINGLLINGKSGISVQVKRSSNLKKPPSGIDYLIGYNIREGEHNYSVEWLIKTIEESKTTKDWLKRSLNWLPLSYLSDNGL